MLQPLKNVGDQEAEEKMSQATPGLTGAVAVGHEEKLVNIEA